MAIMKVLELMGSSEKSWEDAVSKTVKKASKSVKNIRSAYVQDMSVSVNEDKVSEFRVTLKVTFEVE